MVLYHHINNEYADQQRFMKTEITNRTYNLIRSFQDERKPKSQGQQTLLFQFDQMYNDFRNSIEGFIQQNMNEKENATKSYELIKKYNNLSSFLQNIIKINTLDETDESQIQRKFQDLVPLLEQCEALANESGFIDSDEISSMVSKIKSQNFTEVSASSKEKTIGAKIVDRNSVIEIIQKTANIEQQIEDKINEIGRQTYYTAQTNKTIKADMKAQLDQFSDVLTEHRKHQFLTETELKDIYTNTTDIQKYAPQINEMKSNYKKLQELKNAVNKADGLFKTIDTNAVFNVNRFNTLTANNLTAIKAVAKDWTELKDSRDILEAALNDKNSQFYSDLYDIVIDNVSDAAYKTEALKLKRRLKTGEKGKIRADIIRDIWTKPNPSSPYYVASKREYDIVKQPYEDEIKVISAEEKTMDAEIKKAEHTINKYAAKPPDDNKLNKDHAEIARLADKIIMIKSRLKMDDIQSSVASQRYPPDISYHAPPQRVDSAKQMKDTVTEQIPDLSKQGVQSIVEEVKAMAETDYKTYEGIKQTNSAQKPPVNTEKVPKQNFMAQIGKYGKEKKNELWKLYRETWNAKWKQTGGKDKDDKYKIR